jgi:hypothetical protein
VVRAQEKLKFHLSLVLLQQMQRLFRQPRRFREAKRLQMQQLRHDEEHNEGSFRNPFDWDVATGKPALRVG